MTDNSPIDDLSGQQLDDYLLDELLGRGGMACVYRGLDIRLRRETAIKVINTPFRTDAAYVTRFEREAQAIAQLNHPNVVSVYRYGEVNGLLYIAMEYIDGDDLKDVMASYQTSQTPFPPDKASHIIRQICQTLDYIHSQQIIHRDIKPSNIMLNKESNIILTDFGLVRLPEFETQGGFLGTPNYMAPEQVLSSAKAVPQSDLYAVGVILYEMFTASLPFVAGNPEDVALMHVDEPPPSPRDENPDLSPELDTVILKALAKKPEERYPMGVALADALDQALQATPEAISTSSMEHQPYSNDGRRNHMSSQPTVFISYSQEDDDEKAALLTHLRVLAKEGLIEVWSDDQIEPGVTWEREVEEAMARADVAILLISANFLTSDFIIGEQIPKLLQRRQSEGLTIFPVIAKACHWESVSWLQKMDIRPQHGDPVWRENGRYAQEELAALVGEVEKIIRKTPKKFSDTDKLVSTFLDKYQLIALLGQGGMAKVYKTFHSGLQLYQAIKVVDNRLMSEAALQRFHDEARTVANLHHNHIVRVHDFDQAEGKHYMVMDLIEGPTLEAKMKEGRVTLEETVDIIIALADALDYAHDKGIVHHDLKPANVMFKTEDSKERLLLTDFGIARIMGTGGQTIPGMFLGTPNYTSPEQAQGNRGDIRSDVYSLGVILYELVTGRLPFEADTSEGVMRKHINGPVPLPTTINPDLPEAVEQVILKALKKDPADRYQTAGALATALEEATTPEPEPPKKDQTDQESIHLKQRQLPETINRFNEGCSSYGQALNALQAGNTSGYETKLMVAAREVVGALEWALKVYLRQACRGTKDYAKPERANFHQLITLMEQYANPLLPSEIKGHLYDYRDMRNAAEHQPGIPSGDYVGDAIKTIRWVMVTYLSVDEGQLNCSESLPPTTPPPTPPPPHPPDFNLGELRRILDQRFGDADLVAFCLIYFPKVYDRFSEGMRKDAKITLLLDYSRRTPERQASLLAALEEYDE